MPSIPLSKAREQLSEIINQVAYDFRHIVLTKRGKKVAAIVSIEELEFLEDRIDIEDAIKTLSNDQVRISKNIIFIKNFIKI